MIKIYYKNGCGSSRKVLAWFEKHKIEAELINIVDITSADLLEMLPVTSQGLEEVMKSPRLSRNGKEVYKELLRGSFREAVLYLSNHPDFLRTPIIHDRNKICVGFNYDDMRGFLPQIYREQSRNVLRKTSL